ncbi:ABC transporter permease [Actinomadura sp. 9N215]|uniref:ABC transporter permease n=1 Tax=Actinomadura sp. 9N215 TaxID=3375150 RepID=UPI0037AD5D83
MGAFEGTRKHVRLILRRDRILLPVWVIVLSMFPASFTNSYKTLYDTAAEQKEMFEGTAASASYVAMFGPAFGSEIGALGAQRTTDVMILVCLASLLTVIRHTRAEEESGRRELLASTPVGRHAPVTAALAVVFAADLVLGLFAMMGMRSLDLPATGSLAYGLELTLAGWMFATVGAVAAQLSASARVTRGIAIAVLAGAFLLRMAGDSAGRDGGSDWPSWLSPLGWMHRARAYADERWWVFLLAVALAGVLTAATYALASRRDLGAGLVQPRLGPVDASPALSGPLGLAWRLHRGTLVAWSAAFAIGGAMVGGTAKDAADTVNENGQTRDFLTRLGGDGALSDTYIAASTSVFGLVAAAFAIQTVLRLRQEETGQHAEALLSTSAGRLRWAGSHLTFTLLGPAVALVCYGLVGGLIYGASVSDVGGELPRFLGAAVVQLPAIWVLGAVTMALFGRFPSLTVATWAVLGVCFLFGQFGAVFEFDQWLLDVSPFTHVPRLPGGDLSALPLVLLTVVAIAIGLAGLAGLRRRDIPAG